MSHECHGRRNHWQLIILFDSLFRLTTKETAKIHITGPLWRKSTGVTSFLSDVGYNKMMLHILGLLWKIYSIDKSGSETDLDIPVELMM